MNSSYSKEVVISSLLFFSGGYILSRALSNSHTHIHIHSRNKNVDKDGDYLHNKKPPDTYELPPDTYELPPDTYELPVSPRLTEDDQDIKPEDINTPTGYDYIDNWSGYLPIKKVPADIYELPVSPDLTDDDSEKPEDSSISHGYGYYLYNWKKLIG
jgi:hypothetical protein